MRSTSAILILIGLSLGAQSLHAQYLGGIGDGHSADGGSFQLGCTIPPVEHDALMAIYNALGGTSWADDTNWGTTADESSWYGVEVRDCRVVGLHLTSNNLTGTIPLEIQDLYQLEVLELNDNSIFGDIGPVTIPEALEILNLSDNDFSGPIPPEIGAMTSLVEIYLSGNNFSGNIPPGIGSLMNLEILNFSDNQLTGSIPAEFADLTSLQSITVAYNQLSGTVPGQLSDLAGGNLTFADFSHNQFTGMVALGGAVTCDISYNSLDFADLEPIVAAIPPPLLYVLTYAPQADLPPGGMITYNIDDDIAIPFSTGGTANSYQWYKGTLPISLETATNLFIEDAGTGDAGIYRLKITNSLVPDLELWTKPYILTADLCGGASLLAGFGDASFQPEIENADGGIVMMQDGKILTSFRSNNVGTTSVDGLHRFFLDGTLDPSFNIAGLFPSRDQIIVNPDNTILIAQKVGSFGFVAKYDADGQQLPSPNPVFHTGPEVRKLFKVFVRVSIGKDPVDILFSVERIV